MEGLNPLVKSRDHQMRWKKKDCILSTEKLNLDIKTKTVCDFTTYALQLVMEGYSDKCQVWGRIATARQRELRSKQGPQKPRETGYWQVNRELSPLLKGNKFSKKKNVNGLRIRLFLSLQMEHSTPDSLISEHEYLGRAFYPQNYEPRNSCGFEFNKRVAIAYKARGK